MASNHRKPGIHIAWTTITYRTVALRLASPEFTQDAPQKAGDVTGRVLEKVAGMIPDTGNGVVTARQAHFRPLDASIRVKKGKGNTWVAADDHIPYSQGSRSQVLVGGATASLDPEPAVQVHNDPKADQDEILTQKGTGEVTRNGKTVQLANWERVCIQPERSHLEKAKQIGLPIPTAPANLAPLFSNGASSKDVEFSWTPITNAVGYRLRVSRKPYFSSTLVDQKVNMAAVTMRKQASMGASQTRDDCSANTALHGAARPGPSAGKKHPASG